MAKKPETFLDQFLTDYDREEPGGVQAALYGLGVLLQIAIGLPTEYDLRLTRHDYLLERMHEGTITQAERNQFAQLKIGFLDELGVRASEIITGTKAVAERTRRAFPQSKTG